VLALKSPNEKSEARAKLIPLLAEKKSLGSVTTYVCRDFTCQAPLVGPEAVKKALAEKVS
jgi:hypothetical protein